MAGKTDVVRSVSDAEDKTTKERILEVAIDLFAQKGFDAVSMREIAEAVGIKKASLYSHFSGKDELLEHVFNYPWTQMISSGPRDEDIEPMILSLGVDGFMAAITDVLKRTIALPEVEKALRVMIIELYHNEGMRKSYKTFFNAGMAGWKSTFSTMMKHGLIKPADPEAVAREFLSFYLYTFMDYFIVEYGQAGSYLEAEGKWLDEHMAFFVRSIKT